ncbi:MAG: DNA-directed RNA polymerase subunit L [Candidatus Nezhaarchaeota archaeon]|nr:DNA-directed RNA polymerase subunit L [Candidatus Nezhaarchaeota archaeon]MCX8141878.1 DNA-directed RNA polymerase subunit L [Candidatus Nezhaarchaeota archaeon]MDW8050341.1 DNA-directed RNA polymerase subunit L [Nitrososphaerota archaeon]
MKIRILEKDERSIKFEVIGEGHTFCNLLRDFLARDPKVEFAAYKIDHPLVSNPIFFLRTRKGKPEEVLRDAAEEIIRSLEAFKENFMRALR